MTYLIILSSITMSHSNPGKKNKIKPPDMPICNVRNGYSFPLAKLRKTFSENGSYRNELISKTLEHIYVEVCQVFYLKSNKKGQVIIAIRVLPVLIGHANE